MENELGKHLENLRGRMSLRDASEKSGLSHTYIRDLELGKNRARGKTIKPNPESLRRLAEAYGVSYQELMVKAGYLHETSEQYVDTYIPRISDNPVSFDDLKILRDQISKGYVTDIPVERIPFIVDWLTKEIFFIEMLNNTKKTSR